MNNSLFESVFPPVSSKEWMDKIIKDLRGKSLDSLTWHLNGSTQVEPYYTNHRNKEFDGPIHETILSKIKTSSWNIIQDLQGGSKEELIKSLESDVDILQVNEDDKLLNNSAIQCFVSSKDKLDSISVNNNYISLLCNPIDRWMSDLDRELSFDLINEDKLTIHLSSTPFHNAGADDFEEIALMLSSLNEYLDQLNEKQIYSKSIIIELCTGIDFYSSIAKIRAARILIDQLLELYPKLSISITLNASTSSYYTSHIDEHTNLLRHTTMALSAVVGGIDGLLVLPFESPNSLSYRMARNIQHLLKEEAYMDKVNDMMAGSYFFEELSIIFMDKGWNAFKKIEDEGGLILGMKNGRIKEMLNKQHLKRVAAYKDQSKTMIGVNKYTGASVSDEEVKSSPVSNKPWVLPALTLSQYI